MDIKQLVIFRPNDGQTEFNIVLDGKNDTVWVSQSQLIELFGKSKGTISEHIKNIFGSGELDKVSTVRDFRTVQTEGKRQVERTVAHYNLDVIISVGYRVNSKVGVEFRKWATARLKEYLINGYSINQQRLEELKQSVKLIQESTNLADETRDEQKGIVKILSEYALGLDILDGYDNQNLEIKDVSVEADYSIGYDDAIKAIQDLKEKFGGSKLFGNEKDDSFKSSIATIDQTFGGIELYPSIEEKAANLLYFIVKNHSFSDGNKRIAAWIFVWYLSKNNYLYNAQGKMKIGNNALAAFTLMIALSKSEEKELMIKVIINSINKKN